MPVKHTFTRADAHGVVHLVWEVLHMIRTDCRMPIEAILIFEPAPTIPTCLWCVADRNWR